MERGDLAPRSSLVTCRFLRWMLIVHRVVVRAGGFQDALLIHALWTWIAGRENTDSSRTRGLMDGVVKQMASEETVDNVATVGLCTARQG